MPCSPGDEDQVLWPGRGFCEKPPPCFPALTPCLGKVYQTSLSAPLGTSAGPGLPLEHLCSPNFDLPIGSPALHSAPHRVFSKVLCRSVTQHIRGNSEESRDYFCCCWNQNRHSRKPLHPVPHRSCGFRGTSQTRMAARQGGSRGGATAQASLSSYPPVSCLWLHLARPIGSRGHRAR